MSKEIGRYDTSLQMFVEKPKELDRSKLEFQRYLADTGAYVEDMFAEPIDYQKAREEKLLADVRAKLAEHMA